MNTAGRAVLFAGTTVVIALLGMFALGVSFLYGVGDRRVARGAARCSPPRSRCCPRCCPSSARRVGATRARRGSRAAARAPALLGALGRRHPAAAGRRRGRPRRPDAGARRARARRCGSGTSDAGNDPAGHTPARPTTCSPQGFGQGLQRAAAARRRLPATGQEQALARSDQRRASARPGVAAVAPAAAQPGPRRRGDRRLPHELAAERADHEPRQPPARPRDPAASRKETRATVYIGGSTATGVDFSHVLSSKLPLFIGIVVAAVGAAAAGRLPLAADPAAGGAAMNLLSIGASLGIVAGDLPARLARRSVRRRARADRRLHPRAAVRDRVRALDGLRGLPRLAHPRGMARAPRQLRRRPRGSGPHRTRDHGGRRGDGRRLRLVRDQRRPRPRVVRRRASPAPCSSTRSSSG